MITLVQDGVFTRLEVECNWPKRPARFFLLKQVSDGEVEVRNGQDVFATATTYRKLAEQLIRLADAANLLGLAEDRDGPWRD